ncbi:hypothetical protein ZIOFF_075001 [Zingiber officinale]|nr:hypothetical protein ZIOFF_075001 [Zingiber officinale]
MADVVATAVVDELLRSMQATCDSFPPDRVQHLCVLAHRNHHAIQIRRSSYHDVIRVLEIQKALDLTGMQTYFVNNTRVVFLNEHP